MATITRQKKTVFHTNTKKRGSRVSSNKNDFTPGERQAIKDYEEGKVDIIRYDTLEEYVKHLDKVFEE
jgi:hypothetical protein